MSAARIRELEAEIAQLRVIIKESPKIARGMDIVRVQGQLDDLRKRCTDMIDQLRAGDAITIGIGHCPWCSESWPHSGAENDRDQVMRLGYEHDNKCPKNPIRIERDEMRSALVHLGSLQMRRRRDASEAWAIRETANWLGEPFSMARVDAKLGEYLEDDEP